MTIEEAIKYEREAAEEKRERIVYTMDDGREIYDTECEKCAEEHDQIADLLEELIVLRKAYGLACDLLANEEDVECQKADECPNFKDGKCENPMCVKEHFIKRAKEKLQDED